MTDEQKRMRDLQHYLWRSEMLCINHYGVDGEIIYCFFPHYRGNTRLYFDCKKALFTAIGFDMALAWLKGYHTGLKDQEDD